MFSRTLTATDDSGVIRAMTNKELMDRTDAAEYLGVTKDTLAQMASRGIGPRFAKLSGRLVRYRRADIDAWIEENLTSTSPQR